MGVPSRGVGRLGHVDGWVVLTWGESLLGVTSGFRGRGYFLARSVMAWEWPRAVLAALDTLTCAWSLKRGGPVTVVDYPDERCDSLSGSA